MTGKSLSESSQDSPAARPSPTKRAHGVVREHYAGLLLTVLTTLAAAYISDHYGVPITLIALLMGLALNFLGDDERLAPGLTFASQTLLRVGVTLIGLRVTVAKMLELGPISLGGVVLITTATIMFALLLSRWLRVNAALGAVAGIAVAICGASAAMALASLIGERHMSRAQLTFVLVGISALSSLALVVYPLAAHALGFTDLQAGFFIGATVHDVAQTLGAGYSFSAAAGDAAAIVKLTRVALLAPVLIILVRLLPRSGADPARTIGIPWFVIGFFLVAAVNSTAWLPRQVTDMGQSVAAILLACAVTATGIRSPMHKLVSAGFRPLLVIGGASILALILAGLVAMEL